MLPWIVVGRSGHIVKRFKSRRGAFQFVEARKLLAVRRGWNSPELHVRPVKGLKQNG